MELKYLKTLKTIIDEGSFLRAAERLNYSQSTITFQVQQLENELKVQLFEKIGRRMIPTQTALELIPHVDIILDQMSVIRNYSNTSEGLSGELNISMADTLLAYRSQEALRQFREQAPLVRLSLQTQNCFAVRELLLNGKADCGFHYDVGGYGDNFSVKRLSSHTLSLICSPLLEDRDYITCKQRKNVCLIAEDKNSIFIKKFQDYLHDRSIILDNLIELKSIEAVKRSVESNIGIAILPHFTVEQEITSGSLHEIPLNMVDNTVTSACIYHKNKWLSPALVNFISLMEQTI